MPAAASVMRERLRPTNQNDHELGNNNYQNTYTYTYIAIYIYLFLALLKKKTC